MKFIFKTMKYQLYLLQLENYELLRFLKLLFKKGLLPKKEQRKELVWTGKALAILTLAVMLHFGLSFILYWKLSGGLSVFSIKNLVLSILFFLFLTTLYFILYTVALALLWPIDWMVKQIIVWRAKSKILNLKSQIKIIGIAGSYGKTTMKEILTQVLSIKYQVLSTPESVNTPVGIARWVLQKVSKDAEILIVEMGEHYKGDVEEICNLARPDIAVVTGINEAHLERMKTLENITETIFELVTKAKAGALVVLNGDDKNVEEYYTEYVWPDHRIERFKIEDLGLKKFDSEKLRWEAEIEKLGKLEINLLGEYALGDVSAAIQVAKSLGMANEEIKKGIANIKPVEHRLQPIKSAGDVLVIDDAYNGNPAGVAEAIKVLSRFENRRKLFITPGLVEIGKASAEVHRKIGEQLAGVADVVILIRNSVTPFIELGIKNYELRVGGKKPEIIIFDSATEAHSSLPKILKPNDVIVFQNDWGDQYI